jgi:rare lipoprotein A
MVATGAVVLALFGGGTAGAVRVVREHSGGTTALTWAAQRSTAPSTPTGAHRDSPAAGGPSASGGTTPTPVSATPTASPGTSAPVRTDDRASRGQNARTASPKPTSTTSAKVVASGSCEASYYSDGQATANGEQFDPDALTAAHQTLPFNTEVRVTNAANGRTVTVRINDRGPYVDGRCLDLSRAAFGQIASLDAGVADVRYEVLGG